jgi:hypothetical protein
MKQTVLGLLLLGVLALLVLETREVSSMSMPDMVAQCDPEFLQQIESPKIKKICGFLENYANAMRQYNKENGESLALSVTRHLFLSSLNAIKITKT